MDVYLANTKLYGYTDFKEQPASNAVKNITLNGNLYVDILNERRGWTLTWGEIKAADFAVIRAIYDGQFKASGGFVNLQVPALGLNTYVWVDISEKYLRFNGQLIENFTITLLEQYAIS